jgi:phosphoribosyl 1,2-cyclic phosphodiesterase
MSDHFKVRFWGVRGSHPVPGANTVKYGGNTPCIEVQANGHLIILDGGTGIIHLGNELLRRSRTAGKPISAILLLSHTHHDHTQGIPYFKPAYVGQSVFYIFGPRFFDQQVEEAITRTMLPPNFPLELRDLKSLQIIRNLEEWEQICLLPGSTSPEIRHVFRDKPINYDDVVAIDVLKNYAHPKEGSFFYRVSYNGRSVVYATDTEGYIGGDQKLVRFSQGADVLIHDAQYTEEEYLHPMMPTQGWGHSTPRMAIEVARQAGVKRLLFFHHDPGHTDSQLEELESAMQKEFSGSQMAHEGLEIDLMAL